MRNKSHGFTIIEILVAILILGIFLATLSTTLTGSLRLNSDSQKQLNTASDAQRVMEDIRNAWNTLDSANQPTNYDTACALGVTVPSGYTVKYTNLSSRAEIISTPATNDINTTGTTCPTATGTPPVMRRIIVQTGTGPATAQVVGNQDTRLTLDVLRPQ